MAGGWCVRSREGFGIVGDASIGMVLLTINAIDVFTRATRRVTVLHWLSRLKEYTKKVYAPSQGRRSGYAIDQMARAKQAYVNVTIS